MSEFFHMGGFGAYIWSAMGVALLVMFLEPIFLIMQRKSILKNIKRARRLEKRQSLNLD